MSGIDFEKCLEDLNIELEWRGSIEVKTKGFKVPRFPSVKIPGQEFDWKSPQEFLSGKEQRLLEQLVSAMNAAEKKFSELQDIMSAIEDLKREAERFVNLKTTLEEIVQRLVRYGSIPCSTSR